MGEPTMSTQDEIPEDRLDELDAETVEDLDADEDAEDVRGGTTWACNGLQ
jgi:hypothetical protein